MLTGEMLPASTVIALHLYKSAWRDFAKLDLGLDDIDDVGNGLLLWKPIAHAFDTSTLCFVYDKAMDRYIHVLWCLFSNNSFGLTFTGLHCISGCQVALNSMIFADCYIHCF